ncbi:MAG: hypothetical protein Q8O48_01030, partial [Anaerolineales bacterium]|nr:hypothetical protein [Anaerolineales bacterium]
LTLAVWAREVSLLGMKRVLAIGTGHLATYTFKMQLRALCDSTVSKKIPVKLNRVIHDGCKFSDHQVNSRDLFCPRLFRMAEGYIQNALSYRKFVHVT